MKVTLIATSIQEEEFFAGVETRPEWKIFRDISGLKNLEADVCIDLQYENTNEYNHSLSNTGAGLIIVNHVTGPDETFQNKFVRINGWNTFLGRKIIEAAATESSKKKTVEEVFSEAGKKVEWLPDIPGFISCRVTAQIVNEAYFSLEEGVSTKQEIDTAMKLGTNYPFGPFEWSEKIGLKNIALLLKKLSSVHERYQPATLLLKESNL